MLFIESFIYNLTATVNCVEFSQAGSNDFIEVEVLVLNGDIIERKTLNTLKSFWEIASIA